MFIYDPCDKSGFGMYSHAGRTTIVKHDIFKKKDEILNDKPRTIKVRLVNTLPSDVIEEELRNEENLRIAQELASRTQQKEVKKEEAIPIEKQPFTKTLSREKVARIFSNRCPPPPLGVYNPKALPKNPRVLRNYEREMNKTIPRIQSAQARIKQALFTPDQTMSVDGQKMMSGFSSAVEAEQRKLYDSRSMAAISSIPEKPKAKLKGYVELEKQSTSNYKSIYNKVDLDPEGKMFEHHEIPSVSSNYRRPHSFKIGKVPSRGERQEGNEVTFSHYQPNFEYGKKRLASAQIRFDKMTGRRPNSKISSTTNEDFYDYDSYAKSNHGSHVFKRVPSPNFNKGISREQLKLGYFSSFLQKRNENEKNGRLVSASIRQKEQKQQEDGEEHQNLSKELSGEEIPEEEY